MLTQKRQKNVVKRGPPRSSGYCLKPVSSQCVGWGGNAAWYRARQPQRSVCPGTETIC